MTKQELKATETKDNNYTFLSHKTSQTPFSNLLITTTFIKTMTAPNSYKSYGKNFLSSYLLDLGKDSVLCVRWVNKRIAAGTTSAPLEKLSLMLTMLREQIKEVLECMKYGTVFDKDFFPKKGYDKLTAMLKTIFCEYTEYTEEPSPINSSQIDRNFLVD
jgi:hypothetical protein